MQVKIEQLFSGDTFLSREAFNENKKQVLQLHGIYAWYFMNIPKDVPTKNCHEIKGKTLLYLGISPSNSLSKGNVNQRINQHFNGNSASSTLRKSLGCLLGYKLIGEKNKRFSDKDEQLLSIWISKNAYVKFEYIDEPWKNESDLISKYSLPLNLECNKKHEFHDTLKQLRKDCK